MGTDLVVEQAKRILRRIEHHNLISFTRRDLHQAMKGTCKRVEDLDRPLAALVAHGFVRLRDEVVEGGPGRRPSPTYDVNPIWLAGNAQALVPTVNSEDCEHSEKPKEPRGSRERRGA